MLKKFAEKMKIAVWIGAVALLCFGQSSMFAEEENTVSIKRSEVYSESVDYWTDEMRSAAEPMPFYDQEADPYYVPTEQEEVGAPGSVPSFVPGIKNSNSSSRESEVAVSNINFGTPDVFDSGFYNKERALWNKFPWNRVGKLFFTSNGGSGYCSASVIGSNGYANSGVIVTAAHCCWDRGTSTWMSDLSFAPAYRNGQMPMGIYPYASVSVLTAWISVGGRHNDVCVISLLPNRKGAVSRHGTLGRSWNYPTDLHHHSYGYPGNQGGGEFLYGCSSESYANCGDSSVLATGCDSTYGSSGGPWIRKHRPFDTGSWNYVNSVVSGYDGCTSTLGLSYNGARFTNSNIVKLCDAENCD